VLARTATASDISLLARFELIFHFLLKREFRPELELAWSGSGTGRSYSTKKRACKIGVWSSKLPRVGYVAGIELNLTEQDIALGLKNRLYTNPNANGNQLRAIVAE
jgi:hypothetical protein